MSRDSYSVYDTTISFVNETERSPKKTGFIMNFATMDIFTAL